MDEHHSRDESTLAGSAAEWAGRPPNSLIESPDDEIRRKAEFLQNRLAAIVESSDDAIISKDLQGIITTWNRGAQRLFGYSPAEAIGQPITLVIPTDRLDEEPQVLARIMRGEALEHFETVRQHKSGALLDISLTVSPIRDSEGVVVGASKIARDISEKKRIEQRFAVADRRKDEFLATLSHELRNPLAPLRTSLDYLCQLPDTTATTGRFLEVMRRQVDHLVHLVDDLLEVSRISRGVIQLVRQPLALAAVIDDAVAISRSWIDARQHRLTIALEEPALQVMGDHVRLVQVFSNILNNAAKFTPPGGGIAISLVREGDSAVARIRDTGIGIAHEDRYSVFEMFTQLAAGRAATGGLGVGLALTKGLLDMHGGDVALYSEGAGRGTTFTVRVPLHLQERLGFDVSDPNREPPRTITARRILVVDDNRDNADALQAYLRQLGHQVDVAYSGTAALALADRIAPEVVVLDIGMPGMNGFEVAKAARRRPWGVTATLVALTGWGQESDRRRTREAGFDHHLVKPVQGNALASLL